MSKFLFYPLNIALMLLVGLIFSLLNLSFFYKALGFIDIIFILVMIFIYVCHYLILKKYLKLNAYIEYVDKNKYRQYLLFSFFGFLVEFGIYGIPLLNSTGREDFSGIPVLHVVFYSCMILSVLLSSLYSNKKDLIICLLLVFITSILLLSRQMMMIAFVIAIVASALRYQFSKKTFVKVLIYSFIFLFLFGVIGNIRQQISGDYFDSYIIIVGGANEKGELLGNIFYWIWLYIASPLYNLIVNFNSYYLLGEKCNTSVYYGSCNGNLLVYTVFPETFLKYLGIDKFEIDLQMAHLNVGTAYAVVARIWGLPGVIFQIFLQGIFFYLGYLFTPSRLKSAFLVYFSTLSLFMIFDNLFLKGEFFFVFVIIFLSRYNFVFKIK